MLINHIILAALWGIYFFLHSYLASLDVKRRMQSQMKDYYQYYRLGYNFLSITGLIMILFFNGLIATSYVYQPEKFSMAAATD